MFDDGQKRRLFSNVAEAMEGVPQFIVDRQLALFDQVHPDYGQGVRDAIEALAASGEDHAGVSTSHAAE